MNAGNLLRGFVSSWVNQRYFDICEARDGVLGRGKADGSPVERVYLHIFDDLSYLIRYDAHGDASVTLDITAYLDETEMIDRIVSEISHALGHKYYYNQF